MKEVTPESAFTSVNVPLHPGAAKYYDEAGIAIPGELRP
ncbi:TAXI family TRAP transporter solute-binding subunit [uncultured Litoreibacter sp.]